MIAPRAAKRRTGTAIILVLAAVHFFGAPVAASSGSSDTVPADTVAAVSVDRNPMEVSRSWSPEEMAAAAARGAPLPTKGSPGPIRSTPRSNTEPGSTAAGDFSPEDPTAWPYRAHGKVFFRSRGENFSCSGTLVDSAGGNVVATAGHCVFDSNSGAFVTDLVFVPAYDGNAETEGGRNPFGTWPALEIVTTVEYRRTGQLGADVAFFTVSGRPAGILGSRKILFGRESTERPVTILGYPARPESLFDGRSMKGCRSTIVGRDAGTSRQLIFPAALWARPCRMGAGSSGGGWITPSGFLTSIVSYGYCPGVEHLCDSTFGPVLGEPAKALYTSDPIGGAAKPTASIKTRPPKRTSARTVSFDVSGSGSTPVSLWCRLDRRPLRRCSGTVTFGNLNPGRHVLTVRAIDQTGRRSVEVRRSATIGRGR